MPQPHKLACLVALFLVILSQLRVFAQDTSPTELKVNDAATPKAIAKPLATATTMQTSDALLFSRCNPFLMTGNPLALSATQQDQAHHIYTDFITANKADMDTALLHLKEATQKLENPGSEKLDFEPKTPEAINQHYKEMQASLNLSHRLALAQARMMVALNAILTPPQQQKLTALYAAQQEAWASLFAKSKVKPVMKPTAPQGKAYPI